MTSTLSGIVMTDSVENEATVLAEEMYVQWVYYYSLQN